MPRPEKQCFREQWEVVFTITTPSSLTAKQLVCEFRKAKWTFESELALSVDGRVTSVSEPKLVSQEQDERCWNVAVEFALELSPWNYLDPDHYSRYDILPSVSATATLPGGWEIIETSKLG